MSYAWNKLRLAVHCLTGSGPQRERLAAAIAGHLACLRPKDLPSAWRGEFTSVIGRFCLAQVQEQAASVKRTVETLDDEDVGSMIGSILRLYDAVARYQPLHAAEEVPGSTATPRPPDKGLLKDHDKRYPTSP